MARNESKLVICGRHAALSELLHRSSSVKQVYLAKGVADDIASAVSQSGLQCEWTSRQALDERTGGVVHQGIVLLSTPWEASLDDLPTGAPVIMLDGVEDPRNIGRAARTCVALGAAGLIVESRKSAKLGTAAYKTAVGGLSVLPVVRVTNLVRALEKMKERGFWATAAEADESERPWDVDLTGSVLLIVGGEDRGVRRVLKEAADHRVAIPMSVPGYSLNAADAVCTLLYESRRQRSQTPTK